MKKTWVLLSLGFATLILAGVCIHEAQLVAKHQTQLQVVRGEANSKEQEISELRASKEHLAQQQNDLLREASAQATQLQKQLAAPAPAAIPNTPTPSSASTDATHTDQEAAGFGKLFSKMMADPETKKFIKAQQQMMMDQLYGPLVKQLGLTPEQADKFKKILTETAMKGAEKATSLFGGDQASNRADRLNALVADNKQQEDQLKELLGDDHYAQYKAYQETAGERMQLSLFKQQTGVDLQLNDSQTEQLLAFMKEEKQSIATTGQPVATINNDPAKFDMLLNEDQTDAFLQNQESVNQRVLDRARTVLDPDQLNAFSRFQTNQLQMMRMGMTMARKFLAPASQ